MATATDSPGSSTALEQDRHEPLPTAFATLAAALWHLYRYGRDKARALDALTRLDARTLKDIGLHRTELSSIVHHDLQDPSRRALR